MKQILSLLLSVISFYSYAQEKPTTFATGEYATSLTTDQGNLWIPKWTSGVPGNYKFTTPSNVIQTSGAQYTTCALTASHQFYVVGTVFDTPFATLYDSTNDHRVFRPTYIEGGYKDYFGVMNDSVFTMGADDILNQNGGVATTKFYKLTQPTGKQVYKIYFASNTGSFGLAIMFYLCKDSTVFMIDRTHTIPLQITFPSSPVANKAVKVALLSSGVQVIETTTDLIARGFNGSYVGVSNGSQNSAFVSIKSNWTSKGAVFPTKQILGSYNTFHIIDANDQLFACGSNVCGEIGNGVEYNPYRTRVTLPWLWNLNGGELITGVTHIRGKFKNFISGNSVCFYSYVQDLQGTWYFIGRNKALCEWGNVENNETLNQNSGGYANYPNAFDVCAYELVDPFTLVPWQVKTFNPSAPQQPRANPGINQYIDTDTTTVYGDYSSAQEFPIKNYRWSQNKAPFCTIVSPDSANTMITGMINGVYTLVLTVTNSVGLSSSRSMTITSIQTAPPTANAGSDQTTTLRTVTLDGSGTGTIPLGYNWSKVSGGSYSISDSTVSNPVLSSLQVGVYKFKLTVSDIHSIARDTVTIQIDSIITPIRLGKVTLINASIWQRIKVRITFHAELGPTTKSFIVQRGNLIGVYIEIGTIYPKAKVADYSFVDSRPNTIYRIKVTDSQYPFFFTTPVKVK